jgi:hypothetical protein
MDLFDGGKLAISDLMFQNSHTSACSTRPNWINVTRPCLETNPAQPRIIDADAKHHDDVFHVANRPLIRRGKQRHDRTTC